MELVGKNAAPDVRQFFLGEFRKSEGIGQNAHVLDGLEIEFRAPVAFLNARHGGVGAAVELQIELAAPNRQLDRSGFLMDLFERFRGGGEFRFGKGGEAVFLTGDVLDHFGCGAAAAVAVPVGVKDGVAGFLRHEAAVGAELPGGQRVAGVGGVTGSGLTFLAVLGSDEIRKYPGAVDALPLKDVPGHPVGLVPADLGSHEGVDAGEHKDLRQRGGVAEDVGEPQGARAAPEVLLKIALTEDQLPAETLAGSQVAVHFQPGAAFDVPAAFFHARLDLLEELGVILLNKIVQGRLRGHEFVLGIFFHQRDDGGEGALGFFSCLAHGPEPGDVDVGMPDVVDGFVYGRLFRVVVFLKIFSRLGDCLGKIRAFEISRVQSVDNAVDGVLGLGDQEAFLIREFQNVFQDLQVVIERFDFRINELQFAGERDDVVDGAAGVGVEVKLLVGGFDLDPRVVAVQALDGRAAFDGGVLRC